MTDSLKTLSEHGCFGGVQTFYQHDSVEIGLPMKFSVFLPAQATLGRVPAMVFLAGLTCNDETFMTKAGAQQYAAQYGIALIAPDTSPRGANVPGETDSWDFGLAASFYIDATVAPWSKHYRMESYIVDELLHIAVRNLPVDPNRIGIFGHSMGGHGALTLALKHPGLFRSVSAFAPICAPTQCAWGQKAFTGYLGADNSSWPTHDAVFLMAEQATPPYPDGILIDQGMADKFLAAQLNPHIFEAACQSVGQPLLLRRHMGYDHGYYFISTFMADHMAHHSKALHAPLTAQA